MKAFSRYPRDLVFLVCLASLVHLGIWFYGQSTPAARKTFDSAEYVRTATNILEHGTAYSGRWDRPQKPAQFSKRPPLYPLFIAALRPVSRDSGLIAAAQVLLNFLGAYLMWKILSYLGVRRSWKIGVVAFYLFYPAQLIYTHMVMAEILLQLMLLFSFYFLVRFHEQGKWHHLALCDLFLGLAVLTKPIMLYFWVPNLIYHVWLLRRMKKQQLIFLALIPLLSVTIWSYRNYIHTEYFHFSSIKTSNMLHVNIRGTVRRVEGSEKAQIVAKQIQEKAQSAESFAEASRTVERAFFETMLKNWRTMITVYMRGTIFFFLDPGRFDLYEFLELPHNIRSFQFVTGGVNNVLRKLSELPFFVPPYLVLVGSMNMLLLTGFVYCALVGYYPLAIRLFILVVLAYILLIVAPTGLSRFRLSVMPFLFVSLPPLLERVRALWRRRTIPLVN